VYKLRSMAVVLTVVVLLAVSGCGSDSPPFVDTGASYTDQDVTSVFGSVDANSALGQPTADAPALRSAALGALRGEGEAAASAADLITRTFASSTAGVPVYVERALFNGEQALIVVEAIGPKGGKLSDLRVWVIDETGEVLYSGTR